MTTRQEDKRNDRLSQDCKRLISGGIAGAISKTCTAPLSRMTILFQVHASHHQRGYMKTFCNIYRQEGMSSFWRGNLTSVLHRIPYSAFNFFAYEYLKGVLGISPHSNISVNDSANKSAVIGRMFAGASAGVTACLLTYPFDIVRTRLAVQTNNKKYSGIIDCLRNIAHKEGFLALYRGLGLTLMMTAPNLSINYTVYDSVSSFLSRKHVKHVVDSEFPDQCDTSFQSSIVTSKMFISLSSGAVAAIASSTITFPMDMVRRRLQVEGMSDRNASSFSAIGILKRVYTSQGIRGLYKGIAPEYLKAIPAVTITFGVYESMKNFFGI